MTEWRGIPDRSWSTRWHRCAMSRHFVVARHSPLATDEAQHAISHRSSAGRAHRRLHLDRAPGGVGRGHWADARRPSVPRTTVMCCRPGPAVLAVVRPGLMKQTPDQRQRRSAARVTECRQSRAISTTTSSSRDCSLCCPGRAGTTRRPAISPMTSERCCWH